jgi:RHS repeat-associated protein
VNVTGTAKTPAYDLNGNTLTDGAGKSYVWDAENRLTKIIYADNSSTEFQYNGISQRVRVIEKSAANTTISDKRYLWAGGTQPSEERDASGTTVLKRYFPQGEQIPAAAAPLNKLFYTKDHLGNIRELTAFNGSLQTRYDYDIWGKRVKLSGTLDTDVGYTGHHHHAKSELILTWFRAYDAETGRWLSADPLGESGGVNLYGYVLGDPINSWDTYGLCPNFADPNPGESLENYVQRVAPTPKGFLDKLKHFSTHDSAINNYLRYKGARDVHASIEKGKNVGADIAAIGAGGLLGKGKGSYPGNDPSKAPSGTSWKGKAGSCPGSKEGSYHNEKTGEVYRPDLDHAPPTGPHWDFKDSSGKWWRIFPDGRREQKPKR